MKKTENSAANRNRSVAMTVFGFAWIIFTSLTLFAQTVSPTPSIYGGQYHNYAVSYDGKLWSWGRNSSYQLGDGGGSNRDLPYLVPGLTNVTTAACGNSHSLLVKTDGTAWAIGLNSSGQIGNGTTVTASNFVAVAGITNAISVATGYQHSLAVTQNGRVYAWGGNQYGQLGDTTTTMRQTPVLASTGLVGSFVQVAAGAYHSLALRADGCLMSWGQVDSQTGSYSAWPSVKLTNVVAIAAGYGHSLSVKTDGTVWAWGANANGQLGNGTTNRMTSAVQVSGVSNAVAVASANNHSLALLADGTIRAWGANAFGQLGDGGMVDQLTPVTVAGITNAVAIVAGNMHSMALLSDGTVRSWGWNGFGQLGDGGRYSSYSYVAGLNDGIAVAAGEAHNLAIRADQSVVAWGFNYAGQVGDGTQLDQLTPVPVTGLTNVSQVLAGSGHSVALKTDGTVWAWGANISGQLGAGNLIEFTPIQVPGMTAVSRIGVGAQHTLAVQSGIAYGWGYNVYGQIGVGSTASSFNSPVMIPGLGTNVVAVAGGGWHSLGVRSDGTLWSFGQNNYGQLGIGNTTQQSSPVQITGISNVTQVSAGNSHSVALKADGTVWAWGINNGGQLGDGSFVNRSVPVQVSGLTNIISVVSGYTHNVALQSDGSVWTWGGNAWGQLGDGTTARRLTPYHIPGVTAIGIAVGTKHTVILQADGTALSFGDNYDGQLGDGTIGNEIYPVTVENLHLGPPPAAPSVLWVTISAMYGAVVDVTLYWADNSNDETGFVISRAVQPTDGSTPVFQVVGEVAANVTSFSELPGYGQWLYKVNAKNLNGLSADSDVRTVTLTPPTPPVAPTNLGGYVTGTYVSLTWTDNANNEQYYIVSRAPQPASGDPVFQVIRQASANVNYISDQPGYGTWIYKVHAQNPTGSSADSNTYTATVLPPPPAAPTNLTAAVSGSNVVLNWSDNSTNESGFEVYRAVSSSTPTFTKIGVAAPNARSFTDVPGKGAWLYKVRAFNSGGVSGYSNTVEARVVKK